MGTYSGVDGAVYRAGLATLVGIIIPMIELMAHPELPAIVQGVLGCVALCGRTLRNCIVRAHERPMGIPYGSPCVSVACDCGVAYRIFLASGRAVVYMSVRYGIECRR